MSLSDAEVTGLRNYLLGGGFLMVDDFWGAEELGSLRSELRRVFPNREPVELSTDHEIVRSFYEFNENAAGAESNLLFSSGIPVKAPQRNPTTSVYWTTRAD